jgi:hypothetical protein
MHNRFLLRANKFLQLQLHSAKIAFQELCCLEDGLELEAPQSRAELAPKPISGKNAETQKISATSFDGNFNNLLSL